PSPTYEAANAAITLNPGYGCSGNTLGNNIISPLGCTNPADTPGGSRKIASTIPYKVSLGGTYIFASEWTYHAKGFDIRYQAGAVNYNDNLNGRTPVDQTAPVLSYNIPCNVGAPCLQVNPR